VTFTHSKKTTVARLVSATVLALLSACGGSNIPAGPSKALAPQTQTQSGSASRSSANVVDYSTIVQQLYVSYFGRPADTGGYNNFKARMADIGAPNDIQKLTQSYKNDARVRELIDSFSTSPESASLYSGDDTAFVTAIYANILGRAPDAEGLAYWAGEIKKGNAKRSDVTLSIMAGALLNTTPQGKLDGALIEKKLSLASSFTNMLLVTSVNGYAGDSAAAKGRAMLSAVSSATTSASLSKTAANTVGELGRISQPNGTVVIRVVATTDNWGQGNDGKEAFINATPTKLASGYKLYDLRLSRAASYQPTRVDLWDFADWNANKFAYTDAEWKAYMASHLLLGEAMPMNISWKEGNYDLNGASTQVLASLKKAVDEIAAREQPARIIIQYAGHGASYIFFEGVFRLDDGRAFLQYLREKMPASTLVLDFSTNCQVAYYEFFAKFYDVADYLLASEQNYGGFEPGDFKEWLTVDHFQNSHQLFGAANSMSASIDAIAKAREGVYKNATVSLNALYAAKNHDAEQSFGAYDLSKFKAAMKMVAAIPNFNPEVDLASYSNDLSAYIHAKGTPAQIATFDAFQVKYTSSRNVVTWTDNTRGFVITPTNDWFGFVADLKTWPTK
jgi:hypothetical protein